MSAPTKYRMIGTTDDVIDCEKCGKADLRMTVVLEMFDTDGNSEGITYYGSTCAARALAARGVKRTTAQLRNEATAADRQRKWAREHAEQMLTFYSIPDGDMTPEDFRKTVWVYREHNPSIHGLRTYDECARFLRDGITRWRAAVAA